MHFIDSHAHLSKESLQDNIQDLLKHAQEVGITSIINICTDLFSLKKGLEMHREFPWIYNAASTPPHDVAKDGEEVFPFIAQEARQGNLIAIGETGLDYHYYRDTAEIQKNFLRRYLHLAIECQLPTVIHCREAFKDFFEILDTDYRLNQHYYPGVLHCFTGNVQEAEEVLKRGWYLSLSGIVTFKKSEELKEVAKLVPLAQLLIETDTPYLAPHSHRGKPNEPSYLIETAQCIASLKGISLEEVAVATAENARCLFLLNREADKKVN